MTRADLILVNLGTPNTPTEADVRAFLGEFLGDPMVVEKPRWLWLPILHGIILRRRPRVIARAYGEIWASGDAAGGSPLAMGTRALAAAADELGGDEVRVRYAFRYGAPNLEQRIAECVAEAPDGEHPIVVAPLFAQETASSTGTVRALVQRLGKKLGMGARLRFACPSPAAPGYLRALAERVREQLGEFPTSAPIHLLASFHGIPQAVDQREGSQYQAHCTATFEGLKTELGWQSDQAPERFVAASLAYQSRFGREPWIGPSTEDKLEQLGREGASVLVVAPSFLTAGLETIEELGMRGRDQFKEAGGSAFALANSCVAHSGGEAPVPHEALARTLLGLI